jgi:hypothetical protein
LCAKTAPPQAAKKIFFSNLKIFVDGIKMAHSVRHMAPRGKSEPTNLYIPVDVKKAGIRMADDRRLSLSQLVTELIERHQLEIEEQR